MHNSLPQLLPRCMEVHCLQCKTVSTDISGNIHWKCPFFFLTSIYQTGWLTKQFIIVRSPDHLVLIPGGLYYWRDASSTIAREQILRSRKNWLASQIATERANLMKLFAHWLDTQIHLWDQKNPTNPTQEPPENRFSFRKCNENAWKCALSTLPRLKIS